MGIISRRINPFSDQNFKVHEALQQAYTVHKYFYPKPLKTGKREHSAEKINVDNLETEIKRQFEEHRSEKLKNIKEMKDEKLKTKMAGSWYSVSKEKWHPDHKLTKLSHKDLASSIGPKIDPTQSFSRFLNKGILIIRD